MTNQTQPGRPPAHDLSAFDLSKRSPEQLAQSFARWKAQRKRQPEEARGAQPLPPQPGATTVADPAPKEAPKASKRTKSPEYSATFSALLEAGSEPTVQRPDPTPITPRPAPKPVASSGRRLKAMSIAAGAASLVVLAAGALLELSHRPDPDGAKPVAAHPHHVPAAPIAAAATKPPTAAWRLQRIVDLALMKGPPAADVARPMPPAAAPPVVQTASKPVRSEPASRKAAPETAAFVAKPFIPSDATAAQQPAAIPVAPVAVRSNDPRPDALFQQRRDRSTTASDRVASGDKPAEATGARSSGEAPSARTATARGKVASGGSSDPRGEGSGGARVGSAVNAKAGGANADTGGGEAAAPDGGSASSGAGSDDAGSGDTGGSGASDKGSGGSEAGGDGTGGDAAGNSSGGGSGDGDAESGDGEDGEPGGIGGAIDGAVGAVGDALGGTPGSGKGNPDSNDKDQRN